jgi:hypothetical protein
MFSAWRDIITTKKRYSAFNPFGSHEQNLDQNCADANALQLRVSCHQFCSRRRHERNTKQSRREQFYTDAVGQKLHSR